MLPHMRSDVASKKVDQNLVLVRFRIGNLRFAFNAALRSLCESCGIELQNKFELIVSVPDKNAKCEICGKPTCP